MKNNLKQFEVVDLTYPIAYGVVAGTPQTDTMLINGNYLVKTPANFGHFLYFWPTQHRTRSWMSSAERRASR